MTESTPKIELLKWEGCPSWPETLADLRAAAGETGFDPERIEVREVGTEADAQREGFDGRDVLPPGEEEPVGLTCRIYRLRDGRVSPSPDPDDLREALAQAIPERS
jgi:hypothetical protein